MGILIMIFVVRSQDGKRMGRRTVYIDNAIKVMKHIRYMIFMVTQETR